MLYVSPFIAAETQCRPTAPAGTFCQLDSRAGGNPM